MQAHCMILNINSVKILKEGQTPLDICDQPLFALSMEANCTVWRTPYRTVPSCNPCRFD